MKEKYPQQYGEKMKKSEITTSHSDMKTFSDISNEEVKTNKTDGTLPTITSTLNGVDMPDMDDNSMTEEKTSNEQQNTNPYDWDRSPKLGI